MMYIKQDLPFTILKFQATFISLFLSFFDGYVKIKQRGLLKFLYDSILHICKFNRKNKICNIIYFKYIQNNS